MDNMGPPTERLLKAVADDAGEVMTKAAAEATPKKSGEVAASWRTIPTHPVVTPRGPGFESGTTNPNYKARWLEYGVEAHLISPKTRKALGLPEGARGAANHPGIKASNMTAVAAVEVEVRLDQIACGHLLAWQHAIESGASRT